MKFTSRKSVERSWWSAWATAWGPIGAVAGEGGLLRLMLPHYPMKDLCDLLVWEHPASHRDDAAFAALADLTREYFSGRAVSFDEIPVKLPSPGSFAGKVLRACREIPYGATRSYLEIARQIGQDQAARAVATALSKNPVPLVTPCHRVIYSDGRPGGFTAPGGAACKQRMLDLERSVARRSGS